MKTAISALAISFCISTSVFAGALSKADLEKTTQINQLMIDSGATIFCSQADTRATIKNGVLTVLGKVVSEAALTETKRIETELGYSKANDPNLYGKASYLLKLLAPLDGVKYTVIMYCEAEFLYN